MTRSPLVSELITWSCVTVATPEPASSSFAPKCTVTLLLFQSSAFGGGLRVWVTVGAMLSHLSATSFAGSALPALSTAQYATVPAPLPSSGTLTVLLEPVATCSTPPSTL